MGVGASNPNIVQGLTIYASQKDSNTVCQMFSAAIAKLHDTVEAHSWSALLLCQIKEGFLEKWFLSWGLKDEETLSRLWGWMENPRQKVWHVQRPSSEGGLNTSSPQEKHWAWVAQVGQELGSRPMPDISRAAEKQSSTFVMPAWKPGQVVVHQHQTLTWKLSLLLAGHVSGQEFHDASQEPPGIGYRSTGHMHIKQRCRSHLTSAHHRQSPLRYPLFGYKYGTNNFLPPSWESSPWQKLIWKEEHLSVYGY